MKMVVFELVCYKICVNVVCFGVIDINIDDNIYLLDDLKDVQIFVEFLEGYEYLFKGEFGILEQVVNLVFFLVFDEFFYVIGI